MRFALPTGNTARLGRFVQRLRRSESGVAAVEFGLILPIMFFLFVGTIEISMALTVDRRVTQAASSTADLIARAPTTGISTADVDGSLLIGRQLLVPFASTPLLVKIVSVKAKTVNGATSYVVDWSRDSAGNAPYAANASYTKIPVGLLAAGESVIVSETTYDYSPLVLSYFITNAFTMSETFFMKPRNVSCVSLKPVNCVTGGAI